MNPTPPPAHNYRLLYCRFCGFRLNVPIDCGNRFCPVCSKRRAFRIRNRISWILSNHQTKPGFCLKMITLSRPNCDQLDEGVSALVNSFRRLRQRKIWIDHVSGGATVIEVTGRPHDWHPHLHILCYSRYIPWKKLRSAWQSCSGGTAVYIQNMTADRAKVYVTKYVTKTDSPPHLSESISNVLRKYRLFQRFGDWHSLRIPKKLYDYPCPTCGRSHWIVEFDVEKAMRSP